MWRTTLKSIGAHKRRLLSTCTAVLLGVAFLSGTLVLGDTMTEGFGDMFTEANAGTDAVVRSATEVGEADFSERGLVERSLVDEVAAVDGVAAAEARIEGSARIVGADGDPLGGNGPPTQGGNWIADDALNPYDLSAGRAPEAPGEVVIDKAAAESGDLAVGDTTTVRTPEPIPVTIVGLATFGDADSQGPITYAAFTTDQAADLFMPDPDRVSSIAVSAAGGVSQDELVQRIDAVLPDGVESLTGAELTAEMEDGIKDDFLGFFETFLLVFAGIALVVATFSIYNTFSILVAQRTRESALLRALGASRGQVLRSIAVEALAVGLMASVGGIVVGLGLASGLLALMGAVGMTMPASSLVVAGSTVVTAVAVGVVVTLVASLAPAVRAARTAPLEAIRNVAVDASATSWVRALAGVVVTGAGIAVVVAGAFGGTVGLAGLGALLILVGVVMLGPIVARPAAGLLGAPQAARRGMSGTLARRNAMRNPRRTASTALALLVGVAVVSLMTVVGASIKQSIANTVDEQFAGDLVIMGDDFSLGGLSPDLTPAVADLPEVAVASPAGNAPVRIDGDDTVITTFDPATLARVMDVGVVDGSITDVGVDQIAVSQDYAEDHDLDPRRPGARDVPRRCVGASHRRRGLRRGGHVRRRAVARGRLPAPHGPARRRRRDDRARRRRVARRGRGGRAGGGRRVQCARRPDGGRVHRLGGRRGRHDAQRRLRPAGAGDRHRPDGHRQHAVAVDPRADPRARPAPSGRADPAPAPLDGAGRGGHGGAVRHRRRRRPRAVPGMGDGRGVVR